jgi:hypothetical protein
MNTEIHESASRFLRAGKFMRAKLDLTRTMRKRQRREDRLQIAEALQEMEDAGMPIFGGA